MNINKEFDCDVLIVGGGIAGLIAAERALKVFKRVCIADSSKICSGASYFPLKATLGIQATKDENDYDKYYEDITNMGKGVENPELIKTYIKNIKRDVYLLKRIGFKPWIRKDSRPACFAKYSRNIFLINDWNGARKRANKIFRKNKRLKIFEESSLIRIIKNNDQVYGAVFQNKDKFFFIKSKVIILAAGGIAGNYKNSLYPKKINGTCHITALDAGAYAQNMEFIQFIPAYLKPKYNVLFGEHTLKYCIGMYDEDNKLILDGINDDKNKKLWIERSAYAPFSIDFESSEIDLKIPYSGVKLKYSEDLYRETHPEMPEVAIKAKWAKMQDRNHELLSSLADFYKSEVISHLLAPIKFMYLTLGDAYSLAGYVKAGYDYVSQSTGDAPNLAALECCSEMDIIDSLELDENIDLFSITTTEENTVYARIILWSSWL